jgi:hypothetical protein
MIVKVCPIIRVMGEGKQWLIAVSWVVAVGAIAGLLTGLVITDFLLREHTVQRLGPQATHTAGPVDAVATTFPRPGRILPPEPRELPDVFPSGP